MQRTRRHHSPAFKRDAVALVVEHGYSCMAAGSRLGVSDALLGRLNHQLDRRIDAIFVAHRQRYGSPRIAAALHDEGLIDSENRITRRMRARGLKAIQAKKFKVTTDSTHSKPVTPDRLEQGFSAAAPNQQWTSAITSVWTNEG